MQRNYDISKELQKTKDLQKILEKILMMFLANMDPARQGAILNIIP